MTALFRLLWLGLLALATSPTGDGLVLNADADVLALPVDRSLTVSGSGSISVVDGTTQLAIPEGAFMELNGEPVHGDFPVRAGDALRVRREAGGEVVWDLTFGEAFSETVAQQQVRDEMDAFLHAVGVGSGAGGRFQGATDAPPSRVVIGVTTAPPDAGLAAQLGVSPETSLRVLDVSAGLPAQAAGVQPHDVIVSVDGVDVVTKDSLRDVIGSHDPGELVSLEILRRGERIRLDVPVIDRGEAEQARAQHDQTAARQAQLNAIERALHDHEDMAAHLAARLSDIENERMSRELTLSELHARLEQRESRVAELHEHMERLHAHSEVLGQKVATLQPEHPAYLETLSAYESARVDADVTAQRLDQEEAGLHAVREDLAAVRAAVEAAHAQAQHQRDEMLAVKDSLAHLLEERDVMAANQMAIVESRDGSEALLLADTLAAYQRALERDERKLVEAQHAARAAEREAFERVEAARRAAEMGAIQQQLAREADVARRDAQIEREHAERARLEAYHEALALVEARTADQRDLEHATQQQLQSIEERLARIERLLERLLASQPQ